MDMQICIKILDCIGKTIFYILMYRYIYYIIGLLKYRKFKPTENKHNFAICISGRNEEKVIRNILESIANQDYPLEKITVFVVAHNCTDNTAKIAREFHENGLKVVVYEYNNPNERTKGFALKHLFEKIEQDYGRNNFDGYYIFDADNVLNANYITKMNEAFDEGNKIVLSFRNSKNMNQNWISFSYGMHWIRTCLKENRGKSVLNHACRVQGTGILFANELVKDGWIHTKLTEDRAFCTDAVFKGYKLSYCDEAIFYDEQPSELKIALRQRLRWAKGHLQTAKEYCPKLLKNMFRKDRNFFTTFDMFWINFPIHIESLGRKFLKNLFQLAIAIAYYSVVGLFWSLVIAWISGLLSDWIKDLVDQMLVFIVYRKRLTYAGFWKTTWFVVMFPIFDIIGKWTSRIALFKKVEWKPIPHKTVVNVSTLTAK